MTTPTATVGVRGTGFDVYTDLESMLGILRALQQTQPTGGPADDLVRDAQIALANAILQASSQIGGGVTTATFTWQGRTYLQSGNERQNMGEFDGFYVGRDGKVHEFPADVLDRMRNFPGARPDQFAFDPKLFGELPSFDPDSLLVLVKDGSIILTQSGEQLVLLTGEAAQGGAGRLGARHQPDHHRRRSVPRPAELRPAVLPAVEIARLTMRNAHPQPSRSPAIRMRSVAVAVASALAGSAWANPTGPSVAAGSASFSAKGNTLNITNTPGAIINWQQFSIRPDEVTRFIQSGAMSAVLNRVVTAEQSQILGQLLSNGRVFLINPNGVTVGAGARIDTAGFIASSLNISDADFLSGRMRFTAVNGAAGKVVNEGTITASSGGSVYLIAPSVENHGVITAPNGDVLLAAGKSVEVVASTSPHIRVEITAPAESEALNVGQVVGGRIGIYGGLVRNAGTLNATTAMVGENGNIILKSSGDVRLEGGVVKAAAVDGGNIRIEGDRVVQGAAIDASGVSGGSVSIQANTVLQMRARRRAGHQRPAAAHRRAVGRQPGADGGHALDASGQRRRRCRRRTRHRRAARVLVGAR